MSEVATRPHNPIAPRDFGDVVKFAKIAADSGMVPAAFRGNPGAIVVAIQWGYEVGLSPAQALQSICVINGRPSLWGDGALAVVKSSPLCQEIREWLETDGDVTTAWCEALRVGKEPVRRSFSTLDAKAAGLLEKSGPWQQYRPRMLQMRARSYAMRDQFPDVLRGLGIVEEAQDYQPIEREAIAKPAQPPAGQDKLAGIETALTGAIAPPQQHEATITQWNDGDDMTQEREAIEGVVGQPEPTPQPSPERIAARKNADYILTQIRDIKKRTEIELMLRHQAIAKIVDRLKDAAPDLYTEVMDAAATRAGELT